MVSNGVQFHVSFLHACLRFVSDLCCFCRSWPCQEEIVPSLIRLGRISPDKVTGVLAAACYVLASVRIGYVGSCGGCTEAIPGRYPGRTTECCKTWDPVSGTRAVPGRYPGGTRAVPEAGLQNVTKRGILLEGTDAVYPGGTRAVPVGDHRMM